jgi:hypothetical protein
MSPDKYIKHVVKLENWIFNRRMLFQLESLSTCESELLSLG